MSYDLKSLQLPRFGKKALKPVVSLLENPATRRLLEPLIRGQIGLTALRQEAFCDHETPLFQPIKAHQEKHHPERAQASLETLNTVSAPQNKLPTVKQIQNAYLAGQTTPVELAEHLIETIGRSNEGPHALNAIIASSEADILRQALDSEQRLKAGNARGLLEGVPVAIKDELDALPYPTTVGTRFYGNTGAASRDATVVQRLRAQGAIILGKSNMHEIGIGVTGANTYHGHCRNPYDTERYSGGSSGGSAAAVAAGLCPLAVAADGGGSIRIPAALCGMSGLKPTYGRVSEYGAFPLCWSVAHVGPIGLSVDDVAIGYAAMAGIDPMDANTLGQPPLHLEGYRQKDLNGLKVGVFTPWFQHACADQVQNAQLALESLKSAGAEVQEINIDQLELQRIAHAITISSEMLTAVSHEYRQDTSHFAGDTRLALALAHYFETGDYIQAQRMRQRAMSLWDAVFRKVDMVITPTTGMLAPPIRTERDEDCEASLSTMADLMRFAFPANLCGHPAITVPSGYTLEGLPTGVQLTAGHWQEHLLLRCARVIEAQVERQLPESYYRLVP